MDPGSGYWFAAADDPMTGVVMTPLPGTGYFQFGTSLGEGDGLDITYRAPDTTGPVVTGDRAPDAPVLDASGKRTRLFDLFRGPHSTRLVFGAPAPDEEHVYAVLRTGDQPAATGATSPTRKATRSRPTRHRRETT